AEYAESGADSLEPANALFAAVNSSFDAHEVTLDVRQIRNKYRLEHGGRTGDISESVVFSSGSAELEEFKTKGRLLFRIRLEDLPFAYEAKVQNVKVKLTGVAASANNPTVMNLEISRPGATEHRWHPERKLTPE